MCSQKLYHILDEQLNIPTLVDILSFVDNTKVIEDDQALLSWLQDLSRCENM